MQVVSIYLLSFVSAAAALALWKAVQLVNAPTRRIIIGFVRRKLFYTLVLRRRSSTSEISVFAFINISLLAAANIVACTLGLTNRAALAKRCGTLFLINAVPLFLGGRTSLLVDQIFRLPLSDYHLFHRWIGRICILEGLIHGVINATRLSASLSAIEILLLSLSSGLGALSVIYIRRHMYELFVKSHFTFALALFITLWLHVRMRKSWEFVCLLTASAFWTIHYIIWLARILYRNGGLALSQKAELAKIGLAPSAPAVEVTIQLDRPWKTLPGQYLYLTFPEVARGDAGFIQTHPFVIAWAEGPEITLLIQRRKGVSNTIYEQALTRSSVIVDGPYGSHTSLYTYDKVLFMCSGIGIAAHLLAVRHLLEAHENQSARVRRLTLVWFLETAEQEQWADNFLHRLAEMDDRKIFTLALYVPSLPKVEEPGTPADRFLRTDRHLDVEWYIKNEFGTEAGNMAISVCGTSHFEEAVRHGVCATQEDVRMVKAQPGFHPEETQDSKLSRSRYS